MPDPARLHAIVEGYVQGVGFRYFVQQCAAPLRLTGWVRNRWDSSVEVLAEGERANLEKLLTLLQHGPSGSDVSAVTPEWQPATGEFSSFQIKLTSR